MSFNCAKTTTKTIGSKLQFNICLNGFIEFFPEVNVINECKSIIFTLLSLIIKAECDFTKC